MLSITGETGKRIEEFTYIISYNFMWISVKKGGRETTPSVKYLENILGLLSYDRKVDFFVLLLLCFLVFFFHSHRKNKAILIYEITLKAKEKIQTLEPDCLGLSPASPTYLWKLGQIENSSLSFFLNKMG